MDSQPALTFQARGIYAGEHLQLSVLHAVRVTDSECLVLLSEPRKRGQDFSTIYRAFELIATALHQELRYLKRIRLPIRFFHGREVPKGPSESSWEVHEIIGALSNEQFVCAKWTVAADPFKSEFIEALSSLDQQPKMLP